MSDEIRPDVIKKTQDLLGKYIKKPPLTEKLLKKPPFRFLHDIVTAVIRETGFLNGIFTEFEMKSENIKDKEEKIKFLFKLINTMKMVMNTDIAVRPGKIVAGHEPDKTNELLQAIGRALQRSLNTDSIAKQINEGLDLTKDIKFKPKKLVSQTSLEKADKKKSNIDPKKSTTTPNEKKLKKETSKTKLIAKPVELKKIGKKPSVENLSKEIKTVKETKKEKEEIKKSEKKEIEIDLISMKNNEEHQVETIPKEEKSKPPSPTPIIPSEDRSIIEEVKTKDEPKSLEEKENSFIKLPKKDQKKDIELSSEPQELKSNINLGKTIAENFNDEKSLTKPPSARPRTSLRPPSARPVSARPAAPRIRERNDVLLPPEKVVPLGKVNVIVENFDKTTVDDDNENLVIVETTSNIPEMSIAPMKTPDDKHSQSNEQQGHLVAQILETQKELMDDVLKPSLEIEWDDDSQRNRESKKRYIDGIRSKIQTITRASLPLGQIINFLQEDYDNITRELQLWRTTNIRLSEDISQQKIVANRNLEPLLKQYREAEEEIKRQKEKNNTLKAEIYRNQQKIDHLLNTTI